MRMREILDDRQIKRKIAQLEKERETLRKKLNHLRVDIHRLKKILEAKS